jgi:hypothetical protein
VYIEVLIYPHTNDDEAISLYYKEFSTEDFLVEEYRCENSFRVKPENCNHSFKLDIDFNAYDYDKGSIKFGLYIVNECPGCTDGIEKPEVYSLLFFDKDEEKITFD